MGTLALLTVNLSLSGLVWGFAGAFWGHYGDIWGHRGRVLGTSWGWLDLFVFSRAFLRGHFVIFIFSFCFFLVLVKKKTTLFSVSPKAIAWGYPLVIVPYNESVGFTSFDSCFFPSFPESGISDKHQLRTGRHS